MPRRPDDDPAVAPVARSGRSATRALVLVCASLLAATATVVVFLTEDPQHLRVAVVAAAWAFVLAMFAVNRHSGDATEAAARESAMRRTYELELEREVAARREYELSLENDLRRESQQAVREQQDALRRDIATLTGLRGEVARVVALGRDIAAVTDLRDQVARVAAMRGEVAALGALREDVAALGALREDVAALGALREDVAALGALREDVAALGALREDVAALGALREDVARVASLRTELSQLAELRADMGRLRAELTEQLSGEMLVERIVMRTQANRLPGEPEHAETGTSRAVAAGSAWTDEVPRELTGGWPAVRLDEPRSTRQFQQVGADPPPARPPVPPAAAPPPSRATSHEPAHEPSWDISSVGRPSWETASRTPLGEHREAPAIPADAPRTGWTSAPPPPLPAAPRPASFATPAAPDAAPASPGGAWSLHALPSADRWSPSPAPDLAPRRSRHSAHAAEEPAAVLPHPVPSGPPSPPTAAFGSSTSPRPYGSPLVPPDRPPARAPEDGPAPAGRPDVPPRRRRADELTAAPVPDEYAPTTQRPAVARRPSPMPQSAAASNPELARILAENGSAAPTGSRRRRRYRDGDDSDDVLARVLRGD